MELKGWDPREVPYLSAREQVRSLAAKWKLARCLRNAVWEREALTGLQSPHPRPDA